ARMTEQLGPAKMNQLSNRALKAGAQVVQERMEKAFESFADTGASKDEIVITVPRNIYGVKQIRLGWSGPKDRWRMIHLNENGYMKSGEKSRPRGFGVIKKTIETSAPEFKRAIEQELRRDLW
ncbi:hypothetical protein, partial [Listeria fleischmannii]|uniref:hypothetical protein n=1 Tax=Listeria fleischmannii TaxID=1069827 RepID=UPI001C894B1F